MSGAALALLGVSTLISSKCRAEAEGQEQQESAE
jgi:hypothetical protein